MKLKKIETAFSVCQVNAFSEIDWNDEICFIGKTDEELSLVCSTERVPACAAAREDGWRAFRIEGVLDFSLIGILYRISELLAKQKIGIFAVSTYNTDYILVKEEQLDRALKALQAGGYEIV